MANNLPPLLDTSAIIQTLNVLVDKNQVFEIRILEPKSKKTRGRQARVLTGFFNDINSATNSLESLNLDGAKGIYVTLNPVNPVLLARSNNRFAEAGNGNATSDKDILSRRWLLIDCDPVRPANISATGEEKQAARLKADEIVNDLGKRGWNEPIFGDSGNGYHLLYSVNLPTETELIKNCLSTLDKQFSDGGVSVDASVFNPARIVKRKQLPSGRR